MAKKPGTFSKGDSRIQIGGPTKQQRENKKLISRLALTELRKKIASGGVTLTGEEWILSAGIRAAIKGDVHWARFLFEYAHGKPSKSVDDKEHERQSIQDLASLAKIPFDPEKHG